MREFPLWLGRLRIQRCFSGGTCSIPSPAQWVKELVLPRSCGRGCACALGLIPGLGTPMCHRLGQKKKKKGGKNIQDLQLPFEIFPDGISGSLFGPALLATSCRTIPLSPFAGPLWHGSLLLPGPGQWPPC